MAPQLDRRALLALGVAVAMLPALPAAAGDPLVAEIQHDLGRLGFDAGAADGVLGRGTIRAIKAFQKEIGVKQDGLPSQALLGRLKQALAAGPPSPELLLKRAGTLRSYTRAIQDELTTLGYDPGPIDGLVGPRTRAAIRRYQKKQGLPATGEVSKSLLAHLNRQVDG